ncbi:MAG TPA: inositol monophosphatase family protein [Mycobacteriales bacterium]|nr:inositol monophosphatase family protein [Mycobacteriales bacterium]
MSPVDPAGLLELAVGLAHDAATVLRQRPADLGVLSTKSSPTDVVTVMDRAAERVILDGLAAARPDDAIVSEESGGSAGSSGVSWLVDPLDGTVNYLYGIPHYAVSIAAAIDDATVCGVVVDVDRRLTYTAVAGAGSFADDVPIRCGDQSDPAFALVGTGFNYEVELRTKQAAAMSTVLPAVRDIRRAGSAALDLCAVACGQLDAFFEAGMYPWDWAAGGLIAQEAGARVDGLAGNPPGRNTTLAANPALFDALHELLVFSNL